MSTEPRTQVVLLDADEVDILVLRRALEKMGFEGDVLVADSVASVRGLFASGQAAPSRCIVIADLTIGRDSAFELLTAMRDDHAMAVAPVVVFTASDLPTDRDKARALGAAGFVERPVPFADIVEAIRMILQKAAS